MKNLIRCENALSIVKEYETIIKTEKENIVNIAYVKTRWCLEKV